MIRIVGYLSQDVPKTGVIAGENASRKHVHKMAADNAHSMPKEG